MITRWISGVGAAAAAVLLLSACGAGGDGASQGTSGEVVTVTTVVTASSTPAVTATVDDPVATVEPGDDGADTDATATQEPAPTIQTARSGTDTPNYVGTYQRHASGMDLAADGTGTLNEGASAADGENWAISWAPAGQGITITYQRLLKQYGKGLEAGLAPGRSFTAHFGTGETGKQVLFTSAVPPEIIAVGWCRTGGGGSPECGA